MLVYRLRLVRYCAGLVSRVVSVIVPFTYIRLAYVRIYANICTIIFEA